MQKFLMFGILREFAIGSMEPFKVFVFKEKNIISLANFFFFFFFEGLL